MKVIRGPSFDTPGPQSFPRTVLVLHNCDGAIPSGDGRGRGTKQCNSKGKIDPAAVVSMSTVERSLRAIAADLGCHFSTVREILLSSGVKLARSRRRRCRLQNPPEGPQSCIAMTMTMIRSGVRGRRCESADSSWDGPMGEGFRAAVPLGREVEGSGCSDCA